MQKAAAIAFAVAAALVMAVPSAEGHGDNHHYTQSRSRYDAWNGHQNPWSLPNCFIWSPAVRYWVWICGKPYPPDMPHR